ncbi:MAG: DUF2793 domain-containing protein [Roseinatronobacter sp.]
MSETTARLSLPYILPAQAQKHVTHNEALARLDLLVQLVVEAFGATEPPSTPAEGQIWALGATPSGPWTGQADRLAIWQGGDWLFLSPQDGWRAASGTDLRVWSGTGWETPDLPDLDNLPGLGIGTSHDLVNRLAVASEATLLSHAGADHQLKINKAATTDTASLLFQSGWSGRAEMGLAGNDSFAVKVSPDGANWLTVLGTNASTGTATLPQGAQIDGPVTGLAVTQSSNDTTADRLLRVGAGHAQLDQSLYRRGNTLGTVSQSGGAPTGALVQRGSNSNGEFMRLADGTQICTQIGLQLAFNNAASCQADWAFPAAFAAAPVTIGIIDMGGTSGNTAPGIDQLGPVSWTNNGNNSNTARMTVRRIAGAPDFVSGNWVRVRLVAIGRWF